MMAVDMEQQLQSIKQYFCRICKKGFGCGRALGGHMRAHGIGDEAGQFDDHDDDPATANWDDDKIAGNPPPANKRMYALRTNPNRFKSCKNCGEEFSSWGSFFKHGKCRSEESPVSSPGWEEGDDDGRGEGCGGGGWSKRKRTRRVTVEGRRGSNSSACPSSEEEDLANCLVMLSAAARVDPVLVQETEESCASAYREEEEGRRRRQRNVPSMTAITTYLAAAEKAKGVSIKGLFECKACRKVFNSHQALGGHRASHKKVKGCFAGKPDDESSIMEVQDDVIITHEDDDLPIPPKILPLPFDDDHHRDLSAVVVSPEKKKSRVHECSICHRIFPSGQALGGHKRCHWLTSNSPQNCSTVPRLHDQQLQEEHSQLLQQRPVPSSLNNSKPLDLNLPPLTHHDPAGVLKQDYNKSLLHDLQLPTGIYLQHWTTGLHSNDKKQDGKINNKNIIIASSSSSLQNLDEEGDGKVVKLAKLSDLKDMNLGSDQSSHWLQMGINSAAN